MLALCVSITVMNIFKETLISFIAYFFGDIAVLQESVRHEIYLHLMLLNFCYFKFAPDVQCLKTKQVRDYYVVQDCLRTFD